MDTEYGFIWGPATVERVASFTHSNGKYRVLQVKTPTKTLDIYVSPQGRSVRVFSDGVELKGYQPPL